MSGESLNDLVLEYLARQGYGKCAALFAKETKLAVVRAGECACALCAPRIAARCAAGGRGRRATGRAVRSQCGGDQAQGGCGGRTQRQQARESGGLFVVGGGRGGGGEGTSCCQGRGRQGVCAAAVCRSLWQRLPVMITLRLSEALRGR